ncbi:MAG: hypothetical protein Q8P81_01015, partial [Nanoarchaeota archaeon]|nr:hypothetical protein [Nanoarchaeota archaeon]
LSDETFKRFQKYCADFLKNPSEEKFRLEKKDIKKIERQANKNDHEFIIIRATTNKQEGDVAGSKLLKFCNHLEKEISNLFEVKKKDFEYDGVKTGTLYIVVKGEKEVLLTGPKCEDQKNSEKFRKKHKSTFVKKERLYSKESINSTAKDFIKKWKSKNKKKLEEMSIEKLEILNKAT